MAIFEVFSDSLFRRPRARAQGEHAHHAEAGNEPQTGGVPCVASWRRQCGPGASLPLAAAEPGPSQESGRPTAIAQDEAVQRRLPACGSGSPDCQGRDPRRFQERETQKRAGAEGGARQLQAAALCCHLFVPEATGRRTAQGITGVWVLPRGRGHPGHVVRHGGLPRSARGRMSFPVPERCRRCS